MLVLKIGGSMADNASALASDIASLVSSGEKIVLVHGGGPQVTALEKAVGREPAYIYSKEGFKSRHTNEKTIQNFVMAVGGGVNTSLVLQLRKAGVNAAGISASRHSFRKAQNPDIVRKRQGKDGARRLLGQNIPHRRRPLACIA